MFAVYAVKNGERKTIYNDSWLRVGEYGSGTVIENPVLTLEDNQPGTFKVTIPPPNQGYDFIERYTTELVVCRLKKNTSGVAITETEIFIGRVIDEEDTFMHDRVLTANGELSYLADTRQPTKKYNRTMAPRSYFQALIAVHNSKVSTNRRFTLGTCSFTDWSQEVYDEISAADEDNEDVKYRITRYEDTLTCISDAFADLKNPHIRVRWNSNHTTRYLDILNDSRDGGVWGSEQLVNQEVRLGLNLLDYTKDYDMSDICSVIIPLGARLEGDEGHLGEPYNISYDFGKTLNSEGEVIDLVDSAGNVDIDFVVCRYNVSNINTNKIFYTGRNWNGYGMYAFVDSNNSVISCVSSDVAPSGAISQYTDKIEEVVDIPDNAVYMYAASEQSIPLRLNKYLSDGEAEEYVTVKDITDNTDGRKKAAGTVYVKDDVLLNKYGWIEKVVEFPNLKTPQILYNRAVKYLKDDIYENMILEVKAVDMHDFDSSIDPYVIGKSVPVYERINTSVELSGNITPTSRLFPISKLEITLDSPENSTITLGYETKKKISGITTSNSAKINKTINDIQSATVNAFTEYLENARSQAAELIKNGMHGYVTFVRDEDNDNVISMIVISDTADYQTASNIWVWNQNGLCHAASDDHGSAWENLDTTINIALTRDGVINASRIQTGHMLATYIQGGTLSIGKVGDDGVIDSNIKVYSLISLDGTVDNLGVRLTCEIDENGIMYHNYDYPNNRFESISITSGEVRGYFRNVADPEANYCTYTKVGSLNLARYDRVGNEYYYNSSLAAENGWLFLKSKFGQIFRSEGLNFFSFRCNGSEEYFRIEPSYGECNLRVRAYNSNGTPTMYTGVTGTFDDKNGNTIHVVKGLIVEI